MGYDLHITRAPLWFDSQRKPIPLAEWRAYVRSDPEMRHDGHADATIGGERVLRYENEGLAVWVAYSGHQEDGNKAWFDHRNGEVVVKNPDDEILAKMLAVAAKLGARVQGDDGEPYETPDEPAMPVQRKKASGKGAAGVGPPEKKRPPAMGKPRSKVTKKTAKRKVPKR